MEYDALIKLIIERFPVLGFFIRIVSILLLAYTVYLGSKAKKFLLKSRWLGIEINIENYNVNEEKEKETSHQKDELEEPSRRGYEHKGYLSRGQVVDVVNEEKQG